MKKLLPLLGIFWMNQAFAQLQVDTLAIQTFDTLPVAPPLWTFSGPVVYNSGISGVSAAPPGSPIGIGGSRAWETTLNSGGLVLDFANVVIPAGYDSLRVRFNLAAMNLTGTSGGPDDLDWVLTEISTDGGTTYYNRLRNRGAIANNSFWPYTATGIAKLYYIPQTETVFQPTNSGLQTTEGYSTNEIVFPGNLTQVRIRMTGRSSTTTDTWLVDNVLITGEKNGTSGLDQPGTSSPVRIFPNPAQQDLNIVLNTAAHLEILDLLGNKKEDLSLVNGTNRVNVSALSTGIYVLKITSGKNVSVHRVFIGG